MDMHKKKSITMMFSFYVEGKGIQSAHSKGLQYIKDNNFKHKIEIVRIEKYKC